MKMAPTHGAQFAALCAVIAAMAARSAETARIRTDSRGNFSVAQVAADAPTIESLVPSSGPLGTEVTIVGTNFAPENNIVHFNGTERSFAAGSPVGSSDGTHLRFQVTACPSYAPRCPMAYVPPGNYAVTVQTANGTSNAAAFAIVSR